LTDDNAFRRESALKATARLLSAIIFFGAATQVWAQQDDRRIPAEDYGDKRVTGEKFPPCDEGGNIDSNERNDL
jgi:hypothetical protein